MLIGAPVNTMLGALQSCARKLGKSYRLLNASEEKLIKFGEQQKEFAIAEAFRKKT